MRVLPPILIILFSLLKIPSLGQNREAPSKIITKEFCIENDISKFLATKDETGTNGIFDTSYWRIQIHFETIIKDKKNPAVYHIAGASRHMKAVTPFKGEIVISEVEQYDREFYWAMDTSFTKPQIEPNYNEKQNRYTHISAKYRLSEDSTKRFSGVFSGDLTFQLHQASTGVLINDLLEYEGDGYSNFTYKGTWTNYKTKQSKICYWGEGRLPLPKGVDVGAGEFILAEKYQPNGWQRNGNSELVDNPKNWWKRR